MQKKNKKKKDDVDWARMKINIGVVKTNKGSEFGLKPAVLGDMYYQVRPTAATHFHFAWLNPMFYFIFNPAYNILCIKKNSCSSHLTEGK